MLEKHRTVQYLLFRVCKKWSIQSLSAFWLQISWCDSQVVSYTYANNTSLTYAQPEQKHKTNTELCPSRVFVFALC